MTISPTPPLKNQHLCIQFGMTRLLAPDGMPLTNHVWTSGQNPEATERFNQLKSKLKADGFDITSPNTQLIGVKRKDQPNPLATYADLYVLTQREAKKIQSLIGDFVEMLEGMGPTVHPTVQMYLMAICKKGEYNFDCLNESHQQQILTKAGFSTTERKLDLRENT